MALPESFDNAKDYFEDVVSFLAEYYWIYSYSNTTVLRNRIFERFPKSFVDYFLLLGNTDLNKFPFVHEHMLIEDGELKEFRNEVNRLIPKLASQQYSSYVDTIKVNARGQQKMNNKKHHEVTRLSKCIVELCQKDVDVLVDLGSGCGYLSEALHMRNNAFPILGLEAYAERVNKARERRDARLTENAKHVVVYQQHLIKAPDSKEFINKHCMLLLKQNRPPPIEKLRIGITGLHACADLSVTSIKLFFEMPNVKRLISMPCCYHKLEMLADKTFANFPMSRPLQEIAQQHAAFKECFQRPFLRLACQQTAARWAQTSVEEHAYHGEQMYYRALADAMIDHAEEDMYSIKTIRRTRDSTRTLPRDFFAFSKHFEIVNKRTCEVVCWSEEHQKRFYWLNKMYGMVKGPRLMEALTCLQVTLQRLCENMLLFDRLCFMEEYAQNLDMKVNIRYEKVLNEKLSPRCYVLIAEKV